MKRTVPIFIFTLFCLFSAQASQYRISLLTCGPGKELYASFGHSALRVVDSETGEDLVFNFGMFNFRDPAFYTKFLKGDLDYYLGVGLYYDFETGYMFDDRSVYEQVLNLSPAQADSIMARLQFLYRPENRSYKYKFIGRNCTTELRDLIVAYADMDREFLESPDPHTNRHYLNRYLEDKPWIRTGISLILGARIDRPITRFEQMFLPQQLFDGVATMYNGDSTLAVGSHDVYLSSTEGETAGFFERHYPALILIVLALAIILLNSRTLDTVFLAVLGVLGLLILFLLFYGTHIEFKSNFNILWCNPLLLLLAYAGPARKRGLTVALSVLFIAAILSVAVIWVCRIQWADPSFIAAAAAVLYISAKYLLKSRNSADTYR